jgi:serine/threonine protein kinase
MAMAQFPAAAPQTRLRARPGTAAFEACNAVIQRSSAKRKAADGSPATMEMQPNTELQPGDLLRAGRYEIKQLLRSTRDKEIYLAQNRALACPVVIDVFSNNNSILPNGLTVSAWEAQVLGQLGDHPNIATADDYWEDGKTAIMATRYLSGGTLRDLISQATGGGLPVQKILQLSTEIARGLEHIHGRRILYNDVQPCNVLLDEWGAVHLVDFDTAVSLDEPHASDLSNRPVIVYTAPELTDGGSADERADLYSLGVTMYEMAAGRPPFAGSHEQILAARGAGSPPAIDRDDLPEALRDLIFTLLARDPEQRPASAGEVIKRLDDIRATRAEIERLLTSDETSMLEFKSSLRMPIDTPVPQQKLEHAVLKTIAAFLNTDGGKLVIGIADDGIVHGIEVDYPTLRRQSADGWRCAFDDLVSRHLGTEVMNFVDLRLEPWQGRTIAIVKCSKRDEPTLIGDDELFVRRTASSAKLSMREALAWWRERRG